MLKRKGFPFGLLGKLIMKDYKSRYRRSILGGFWLFLQPASYLALFIILRTIISLPSEPGSPYFLFALAAIIPWSFFSTAITKGTGSVVTNIAIIKKINIVREIFPLSAIISSLIDFTVLMFIYLIVTINYGAFPGKFLLSIPLLVLNLSLICFLFTLITSSINAFIRDVQFVISSGLPFFMLTCPIMYPLSAVPEKYKFYYQLNPLVSVFEGFRDVLIRNKWPDSLLLGQSLIITILLLIPAILLYRFLSNYFADHD